MYEHRSNLQSLKVPRSQRVEPGPGRRAARRMLGQACELRRRSERLRGQCSNSRIVAGTIWDTPFGVVTSLGFVQICVQASKLTRRRITERMPNRTQSTNHPKAWKRFATEAFHTEPGTLEDPPTFGLARGQGLRRSLQRWGATLQFYGSSRQDGGARLQTRRALAFVGRPRRKDKWPRPDDGAYKTDASSRVTIAAVPTVAGHKRRNKQWLVTNVSHAWASGRGHCEPKRPPIRCLSPVMSQYVTDVTVLLAPTPSNSDFAEDEPGV